MEINKIQSDFEKVGATKSLVYWRENMSWAIDTNKLRLYTRVWIWSLVAEIVQLVGFLMDFHTYKYIDNFYFFNLPSSDSTTTLS